MRRLLLAGLFAGCASAGTEQPVTEIDAFIPGMTPDARPPEIDAPLPCTEIMTELLGNPAFDTTPVGAGWIQTPINATYPLVTDQDGISEQSPPYKAWLGGLQGTDLLWQEVMVPARTRLLIVAGFYEVRSQENGAAIVDTSAVALVDTADAPIATVIALDNTKKTTTWTPLTFSVMNAAPLSGTRVRLRMTSTNNNTTYTSFYYDTLSVKAAHCMP